MFRAGAAACARHAAPPSAWPRQETALGLLISLRKFYQTVWVRFGIPAHALGVVMLPACCLELFVISS